MHKRFLRKSQVAERYQVHERTVDRMVSDGRIDPPIYRGKFPLFDEDLLEARERRAVTNPDPAVA